ncbi:MAG: cyclic nucleotide-binding domain-containing protein [Sandaracinus sp.]|nr:cyclic nucleotide-binding domain-containing protein [Sandaracinus sp.]
MTTSVAPSERLRRALDIPDGAGGRATRIVGLVFLLNVGLAFLKTAQSGLFLEAFERSAIPWAFAVSAVVLALASSLCVSLAPRLGPARLATGSLAVSVAALLALRGALYVRDVPATHFLTYVVIETVSGVLIVQLWSVVAIGCDARTARRLLPLAGLGGGLAWTIAGFLTGPLSHALGAESLLVLAPVVLLGALAVLRAIVHRDLDARARRGRRVGLLASWRDGFEFVLRDPLMRLVALLAVLSLLNEQLLDFALMATAQKSFESAEALSEFFGHYYAITSAVGLVLLAGASGRALAALGVTRSLMATPVAIFLAALAATIVPGLAAVVVLRGVGRILKQSLWSSANEQLQTPLPSVRRSQARAAVRGVLAPAGYAVSALLLAVLPADLDVRWLAALVLVSAFAIALAVALRARPVYRAALLRAIDERRVLLGPGRAPSAASLDVEAVRALGEEVARDDPDRAALAAEILGLSAAKTAPAALRAGREHPHPEVRRATLRADLRLATPQLESHLVDALDDDEPTLRREALAALRTRESLTSDTLTRLGELGASDDTLAPIARIARLERELEGEPRGLALKPYLVDRDTLSPALDALDLGSCDARGVQSELARWLGRAESDPDAALLAAATAVRLRLTSVLPDVVRLLKDPRTAAPAARLLAGLGEEGLTGPSRAGHETLDASMSHLAGRLAERSEAPVAEALVLRLLQHPDEDIRRHAVEALGATIAQKKRPPLAAELVEPLLGRDVERAYRLYSILAGLAHDDGHPDWEVDESFAFLAHEVELRIERARRDVLGLLVLTGRRRLVDAVEVGRRRPSAQRDAQVAELLELGLPRDLARRVVPLFERLSLRERVQAAERQELLDQHAFTSPLDAILALGDAHLRRCARLTYGERWPREHDRDDAMVPLYERLRFLRSVPLFRELTSDDVLQLAERVEQVERRQGELVFTKGDPGEDLYLVVRGRVSIVDGGITLAQLGERELFGELAVLDHQPRSADALCVEDSVLLRLRGADVDELLERRPKAMREIVRVLARRLRETGRKQPE